MTLRAFDVFNGDADGLCALVQLRLDKPKPNATLVTGVKRDISLLKQVPDGAWDICVLDVSMEKNHQDLMRLLSKGSQVMYADHHNPGEIIEDTNLQLHIDTDALTCTSLIINTLLEGRFVEWAIAAAYGDNMIQAAERLVEQQGLTAIEAEQLRTLGICLNYNGYGATTEDLHFHPALLFKELVKYSSPFDFIEKNAQVWHQLHQGYLTDMENGLRIAPLYFDSSTCVIELPDHPWARRVNGVLGNELANQYPDRAHAIVTTTPDNDYAISVRAPLNNRSGADRLCLQFPTGGGRKAAAGVNHLDKSRLSEFIEAMKKQYSSEC